MKNIEKIPIIKINVGNTNKNRDVLVAHHKKSNNLTYNVNLLKQISLPTAL